MNEADTKVEHIDPALKAAGGLVHRSHKLAALSELKKSMLHQAFSGQL